MKCFIVFCIVAVMAISAQPSVAPVQYVPAAQQAATPAAQPAAQPAFQPVYVVPAAAPAQAQPSNPLCSIRAVGDSINNVWSSVPGFGAIYRAGPARIFDTAWRALGCPGQAPAPAPAQGQGF